MQPTKPIVALLLACLCVAGTAVALPPASQPQQADQPQQANQLQQVQQVQNPNATLVFTDQTSNGTTVRVNTATLSQGGFVAIHDSNLTANNSTVSSVIGVSERLGPGPHQDVIVRLYSVDGREFNQSRLRENGTLTAMAHFDSNDNGEFDFVQTNGSVDGPYVEGTGVITTSANVSVSEQTQVITDPPLHWTRNPLVIVAGALGLIALLVVGFVVGRRRELF